MTIDSTLSGYSSPTYKSNFLLPTSSFFNVKISICHWQLKDLVCKSSRGNAVFFPSEYDVSRLSFNTPKKKVNSSAHFKKSHRPSHSNVYANPANQLEPSAATFESSARCLKELDGIMVIGGVVSTSRTTQDTSNPESATLVRPVPPRCLHRSKGLFGVNVAETGYTENAHVGTLINNCVTVNKMSNSRYKSLVCNNDQNLYIVDVLSRGDRITPEYSVNMGVALNQASLSPDSRTIVTVGDSSRIFVMHPEEDMRLVNNREVLLTQADCGFSTSWSDSGYQFSACFQEGVDLIYDVRNLAHPLHQIYSTHRQSQNGAFRVCKYSGGTDDLLFISEHQGRVHVVDTRDFMTHKVIMLPKRLYDATEGFYDQPIVKDFEDVCEVQTELAGLSSNRRYIADLDVSRLHHSKFFKYSAEEMPQRFSADGTVSLNNSIGVQAPMSYARHPFPETSAPMVNDTNAPLADPFYYLDSELEICGLDVLDNGRHGAGRSLVIGSESGIIHWDIDGWKRRCFPSYELA